MLEEDDNRNRAALEQLLSDLIERPLRDIQGKEVMPKLTTISADLRKLPATLTQGHVMLQGVSEKIDALDQQLDAARDVQKQTQAGLAAALASLRQEQSDAFAAASSTQAGVNTAISGIEHRLVEINAALAAIAQQQQAASTERASIRSHVSRCAVLIAAVSVTACAATVVLLYT